MLGKLKERLSSDKEEEDVSISRPDIQDLIRPNQIENFKEYVKINDKYYKALMVEGFPRSIDNRFISNLLKNHSSMDISIRLRPYEQNNARRKVRKQLTKLEKDKVRKENTGQISESIQNRLNDIKKLHKKLDKGEERLFDVSLNISTGSETKKGLKQNVQEARSEMNKQQLIPGEPNYKMLQAFKTTLPTTSNKIRKHVDTQPRSMPSGAAAELFPFAGNPSQLDDEGILLGTNTENQQPVLADFYSSTNPNWFTIGTSGSGKSFTAKTIINRYASQGIQTYIIDPHGEYSTTVKNLSGENISLSIKKGNMINPLDMMEYTFREKINSLREFYEIMLDGLSPSQRSKLIKATREAYNEKGIYKDEHETWEKRNDEMPQLEDLYNKLKQLKNSESDRAQLKSFQTLLDKLEPFIHGSQDFLNTHTTIKTHEQVVNFDIEQLPESQYPELMFLILNFLHSRMRQDTNKKKMIVIDEAWELLSQALGKNQDNSSFIYRTVKTSRKYNLSLGLVVQEIHDLINSRQGKSVLANTSNKILLKQDKTVIDKVSSQFNLNQKQKQLLKTESPGRGLFVKDETYIPIQIHGTKEEKQIEQKEERKVVLSKKEKEKQLDDFDRKVVQESELTSKQIKALKESGKWEKSTKALFRGGFAKPHWVETREKLSANHERLVYGYRNWLEDKFEEVRTTSKYADLEIENDEKLIGIEVETGNNINHNKKAFDDKVERNNERYDKWIIICKAKDKEKYQRYAESWKRTEIKQKIDEKVLNQEQ
jgi:hypothetical protein